VSVCGAGAALCQIALTTWYKAFLPPSNSVNALKETKDMVITSCPNDIDDDDDVCMCVCVSICVCLCNIPLVVVRVFT